MRTSTRSPAAAEPGEVDGRVPPRPAAQERRIRPARPLDQHLLDETDALLVPFVRDALDDLDEPLDPVALDLVRNLVRHRGRLGAGTRRVDEGERAVVADLLDHLERLAEVLLRLAGEADDDVGGQRQVGDGGAHLLDQPQVALAAVRPPHRLQHAGRAGLERQVRVLADRVALGHGGDDVRRGSPSGAGS